MLSPRCRYRLLHHSLGRVLVAPRMLVCSESLQELEAAALRYRAQCSVLSTSELAACADNSFDHLVWDGRAAQSVLRDLLRVARSGVIVRPAVALI